MAIPAAVRADLRSLSDGLDDAGGDLATLLQGLIETTRAAVSSYLGITVTMMADGGPYTFTVLDEDRRGAVATSVLFPLPAISDVAPGSVMILYGATPGAFVDLAADFVYLAGVDLDQVVFDRHLIPPTHTSGRRSLPELSQVNQAIGILIGQGHSPDAAEAELRRLADDAHINEHTAAARLIRAVIDSADTG